jgi:DNA-binding CsgD family transcriptional regulator
MKCIPKILDDLPINQISNDFFGFSRYADIISRIIASKDTKAPIVIGLYGKWGTGKTTLLQLINVELERISLLEENQKNEFELDIKSLRSCKVLWFNAWKYGRKEEILKSLIDKIQMDMSKDSKFIERLKTKVSEFTEQHNVTNMAFDTLSQVASTGILSINPNDYKKSSAIRDTLVIYDEFKSIFNSLIKDYAKKNDGGVLVILIDDLDRCVPEKIVEVLETIKLFMDLDSCIFVLALDPSLAIEAITAHYNSIGMSAINPKEYLNKIVQVEFKIPPLRFDDIANYIIRMTSIDQPTENLLKLLVASIPTNPRRIKTFLNYIELQWAIISDSRKSEEINKNSLIEWLILNEACEDFCEKLRKMDNDEQRINLVNEIKSVSKLTLDKRINLANENKKYKEYIEDDMLLNLLSHGKYEFTPIEMGLYLHLISAPTLRLVGSPEELIEDVLITLTPREQRILQLRFGLKDGKPRNLKEIAKEFNLSSSTIRRELAKSLRKLRHPSRSRLLKHLLTSANLEIHQEYLIHAIFGEPIPKK